MKKQFGRVGLVLTGGALLMPLWAGTAYAVPVGPPDGTSGSADRRVSGKRRVAPGAAERPRA